VEGYAVSATADARVENVSVTEVWGRLKSDAKAVLVDVRTRAEWTYVGVPDLTSVGKRPIFVEWQSFPDGSVDGHFTEHLDAELAAGGTGREDEIFFICRSGARSSAAAKAMTGAGYMRCRNVADGFEGPLDPSRHRGQLAG